MGRHSLSVSHRDSWGRRLIFSMVMLRNSGTVYEVRAGGVAQAIECLSSKCEALSSNPSTEKKEEEEEKKEMRDQVEGNSVVGVGWGS
jgi:hypothetical protein